MKPLQQTNRPSPILTVADLSWRCGSRSILTDINFAIPLGSFTGLLGPNGAGKSSLLRCLYRYIKADSGTITFNGRNIWHYGASEYAQQIAVVLQESPNHFNLTVSEVVSLGLVPHGGIFSLDKPIEKIKVQQAIAHVGLSHKARQSFEYLSGGEKQRALIARAIVQDPQLLIMDEPTSHLDVRYQIQVMELAKSLGITVLASFHDLNLASAMSDNLLILNNGTLVANGQPKAVISSDLLSDVFGVCAQVSFEGEAKEIPHIRYHYGYAAQAPINDNNTPAVIFPSHEPKGDNHD